MVTKVFSTSLTLDIQDSYRLYSRFAPPWKSFIRKGYQNTGGGPTSFFSVVYICRHVSKPCQASPIWPGNKRCRKTVSFWRSSAWKKKKESSFNHVRLQDESWTVLITIIRINKLRLHFKSLPLTSTSTPKMEMQWSKAMMCIPWNQRGALC